MRPDDKRKCAEPGVNPDDWFAERGTPEHTRAKTICMQQCPLYFPCQEYALTLGIEYGIWGGMDREDRLRLWKIRGSRPRIFERQVDSAVETLIKKRTSGKLKNQENSA